MKHSYTKQEILNILKTVYLAISNMDLDITDNTSKSDIQTLTASKYRQAVIEQLNQLDTNNSTDNDEKLDLHYILDEYRIKHNLPHIANYGVATNHNTKSKEIYDFISNVDFANGDVFCFKSGGDGDNGEMLMSLLDEYFKRKE